MFLEPFPWSAPRATQLVLLAGTCLWLCAGMQTAQAHGSFHELVTALSEEITAQPANAELYFKRARLHLEHADWKATLIDLEMTDRLAPGVLETGLIRGQAMTVAGMPDAAKALLDEFLQTHVDHPIGLLERARVLKKLEQHEASLADYRLALERTAHPEPDLFHETATALAERGHSKEAVQVLQRGLKTFGDVPSLVLKAMEIETAMGQFDAALTRVEAMRKTAPRPEPWMARRASVLAQAGRLKESRAEWMALKAHLEALPNLERGSHAMSTLAEQAKTAINVLGGLSIPTSDTTLTSKP